jgi:hypothetical protein
MNEQPTGCYFSPPVAARIKHQPIERDKSTEIERRKPWLLRPQK